MKKSVTQPAGFAPRRVSFGKDSLQDHRCNAEDTDCISKASEQADAGLGTPDLFTPEAKASSKATMLDARTLRQDSMHSDMESGIKADSMHTLRSAAYGKTPEAVFSISDLVDNECAKMLQRGDSRLQGSSTFVFEEMGGSSVDGIDWHKYSNKEKLQYGRKLIRQLFHVFKPEKRENVHGIQQEVSNLKGRVAGCTMRLLNNKYFIMLSLCFTAYALFGPDICKLAGKKAMYTFELATVNTFVLVFFVVESLLHIIAVKDYVCSPQLVVDVLAMLAMVGDTWIGYEIWKSDGAASGRAARILRTLRMGGRSTRFIRLLKNMRLVQALRMMPKLWSVLESQRKDLRFLLLYERLYRLFQAMDEGDKKYLSSEEAEILHMCLALEFKERTQGGSSEVQHKISGNSESLAMTMLNTDDSLESGGWTSERSIDSSSLKRRVTSISSRALTSVCARMKSQSRISKWGCSWWPSWLMSSSAEVVQFSCGTRDFESLCQEVQKSPVGKLMLKACDKDLNQVESSFSLMHEAGKRLTLKVCMLVLAVLILLPMLEINVTDLADLQLLVQLDALVEELSEPLRICSLIREASHRTQHKLILIAVNMTVYWTPDCQCCETCCNTVVESLKALSATWAEWSGLQRHELQSHCYPVDECTNEKVDGEPRSIALLDIHEAARYEALLSLLYTTVVVVILLGFVLFFTKDLRVFNKKVLTPLWDLLDDMSAVKCIEFARAQDLTQMGVDIRKKLDRQMTLRSKRFSCFGRITKFIKGFQDEPPELDEMVALEKAFANFRNALRSWTKYVPLSLVSRIVTTGIEVRLGVSRRDVTVFFLDIDGFDSLCKGLSPQEVLVVFAGILQEVSQVLHRFQGTLLEFIGDEMMAVFNAPNVVHKHSTQGIAAAAECLHTLAKLRSTELHARIGVHSANVLAGNLGSPQRLKYGLLGDGVNMTARLKSLNSQLGTRCLVSSTTLEQAEDIDDIVRRPLGRYILKGRTTPTEVWEVLGRESTVPDPLKWAVQQHSKGFELFLQRQFEQARSIFAEVAWSLKKDRNESDKPSRRLLLRCDELLENSPPEDWDGSEKLAKK